MFSEDAYGAKRRIDINGSFGCRFVCRYCWHLGTTGDMLISQNDEGHKLWNMKGSSASYLEDGGVEVKELDLEIFQGRDGKDVDMHILGAQALYESDDRTVAGQGGVFVDGDFYDIEGDNWNYSQNERIVRVSSNVKVVIDYELEAFLK